MIGLYRLYRFRRSSGVPAMQALWPRRPRSSMPRYDDDHNGVWWRGYWTGAPIFFVLGFALAAIFFLKN